MSFEPEGVYVFKSLLAVTTASFVWEILLVFVTQESEKNYFWYSNAAMGMPTSIEASLSTAISFAQKCERFDSTWNTLFTYKFAGFESLMCNQSSKGKNLKDKQI